MRGLKNKSSVLHCHLKKQPPEMFYKKNLFTIFTGKHLCQSLFLITFIMQLYQKGLQHRVFSVNVAKFTRTPTLKNICKELIFGFKIEKPSEFQLSGSNNSFYTPYHGYTLFTTIKLAPPFLTSQMSIKVIIKPKCPCVLLKILS